MMQLAERDAKLTHQQMEHQLLLARYKRREWRDKSGASTMTLGEYPTWLYLRVRRFRSCRPKSLHSAVPLNTPATVSGRLV
mmetsp:Transcript_6645/g.24816  ORF Transcript_6645/g.24816 Transcript_6645/m.24816 type:complete len:81 (-) Transcript_6645:54-296(-)